MDRRVAALLRRRSPTGCRRRRASRRRALFRPLRFVAPIGWIGGRYTTSKPSSASCGSDALDAAKPPHERGKSSYHAPKRASSRVDVDAEPRVELGLPVPVRRSDGERLLEDNASSPSSARPPRARPSRSVCPPASLRVTSSCHDAIRSVHAASVNVQRPGASTVNEPRQRSLPSGSSGASRQRRARGVR